MFIFYTYMSVGFLITVASYISHNRKEKDISEVVHDKLHELRNDDSFSLQSANMLGYLFAFTLSTIFWPLLVLKKILGK